MEKYPIEIHQTIHAFAGREILKTLSISADIRTSNLSGNEAGVGPYISFVSPDTWSDIDSEDGLLDELVDNLPLEEVLIALADTGKKEYNNPIILLVNTIAHPWQCILAGQEHLKGELRKSE